MRIFMTVFYLVLIILGVTFAGLNASPVKVNFYFTTLDMPVSLLMVLMLGLGMLFGLILFVGRYWRLKLENHRIKNQLTLTEKEIKNLRVMPLRD